MVIVDMGRVIYHLILSMRALTNMINVVQGFIGQDMEDIVIPTVRTTSSTTQAPTLRTTLQRRTNAPLSTTQSPLLDEVAGYLCEEVCKEYFLDTLYLKLLEGRTEASLDNEFLLEFAAKPLIERMCELRERDSQLVRTWVDKLDLLGEFDTDGDTEITNDELNYISRTKCQTKRRHRRHHGQRSHRRHAWRFPD